MNPPSEALLEAAVDLVEAWRAFVRAEVPAHPTYRPVEVDLAEAGRLALVAYRRVRGIAVGDRCRVTAGAHAKAGGLVDVVRLYGEPWAPPKAEVRFLGDSKKALRSVPVVCLEVSALDSITDAFDVLEAAGVRPVDRRELLRRARTRC